MDHGLVEGIGQVIRHDVGARVQKGQDGHAQATLPRRRPVRTRRGPGSVGRRWRHRAGPRSPQGKAQRRSRRQARLPQLPLCPGDERVRFLPSARLHQRVRQSRGCGLVQGIKRHQSMEVADTIGALAIVGQVPRQPPCDGMEFLPLRCQPRHVGRAVLKLGVFQQVARHPIERCTAVGGRQKFGRACGDGLHPQGIDSQPLCVDPKRIPFRCKPRTPRVIKERAQLRQAPSERRPGIVGNIEEEVAQPLPAHRAGRERQEAENGACLP